MKQQPTDVCSSTGSKNCHCTPASSGSVFLSILLAFFPKCAFCWAAYLSFLNSVGITIPYLSWLKHVFAGLFLLSIIALFRSARKTRQWLVFGLIVSGITVLLICQYGYPSIAGNRLGLATVLSGSLLNAVSFYRDKKKTRVLSPV